MAQISVSINEREYKVTCENGQEDHVRQLAHYVDNHVRDLVDSVGQIGDARLLALASIVVADELSEMIARVETLEKELGEISETQNETIKTSSAIEDKVTDILEAAAKRIEDLTEQIDPAPRPN